MNSDDTPIRLSKIIAARGLASRGEADRLIERGWVRVDGRIAQSGDRALPSAHIELLPEASAQLDARMTVLLNKPAGFASANDESGMRYAPDLLASPDNFADAGAVPYLDLRALRISGRMAQHDVGLVIYTSDSALARQLAADNIREIWRLDFTQPASAEQRKALLQALPDARLLDEQEQALTLDLPALPKGELAEHCKALTLKARRTRLQRGPFTLAELPEGQWRLA